MQDIAVATLTNVIGHTNLYYNNILLQYHEVESNRKKEWVDYGFAIF